MVKGKALVAVLFVVLMAAVLVILSGLGRKKEFVPVGQNLEQKAEAAEPVEIALEQVRSGDGKVTLLGTGRQLTDGTTKYAFKVMDTETSEEKFSFERTTGAGVVIEVSANSWSPDNKQFFIAEKNGGRANYYVYKADGGKYGDLDYLNVNEYWGKSKNNYEIGTVTGWEGNDLLLVKTIDGPNFWFVISSRGFLRLRG